MKKFIFLFLSLALSGAAKADSIQVNDQDEFVSVIAGKTLTRPWIKIIVTADGRIEGRGIRWDVEGTWTWKNGYFCGICFGEEIP